MMENELILNFAGNKAWITNDKFVNPTQLQLDKKPFAGPAHWTFIVLSISSDHKKSNAEITGYKSGEGEFDMYQEKLHDILVKVEEINFNNIDTDSWLATRKGTSTISVSAHKVGQDIKSGNRYEKYNSPDASTRSGKEAATPGKYNENKYETAEALTPDSTIIEINETFSISFEELEFRDGCVFFFWKFKEFMFPVDITIFNVFIKKEYNAVKDYFAKVLGHTTIQVTVKVRGDEKKQEVIEATSPEIEKINDGYIEKVSLFCLKKEIYTRRKNNSVNRIFRLDEIRKDSGSNMGLFYSDDTYLFNDVLKTKNTKHYRHLQYLSGKHEHLKMKLRMLFKPVSFLFLLMGNESAFYVWETTDTKEATYIWKVPQGKAEIRNAFYSVEKTILQISEEGKRGYLELEEDNFTRIEHDYSSEDKGFQKWKEELERIIKN